MREGSPIISALMHPLTGGVVLSIGAHAAAVVAMMSITVADDAGVAWGEQRAPLLVRITPHDRPLTEMLDPATVDRLAEAPSVDRQRPQIDHSDAVAPLFTTRDALPTLADTPLAVLEIDVVATTPVTPPETPSHTPPPPPDLPDLLTGVHTSAERPLEEAPATPPAASRGVRTPAELTFAPEPEYPSRSIRRGHEGEALIAIDVRADGTIADVRIEQSSGYRALDQAALAAARKCRLTPAKRDGRPIASTVHVPFEFNLRD